MHSPPAGIYTLSLHDALPILAGPTGTHVGDRPFSSSDSHDINNPVLRVPAGAREMTGLGSSDTTTAYGFRLLDLTTATPITAGSAVSGTLEPGNETDVYRLEA